MRYVATIESPASLGAGAAIGNAFAVTNPSLSNQIGLDLSVRRLTISTYGSSVDTQIWINAGISGIGTPSAGISGSGGLDKGARELMTLQLPVWTCSQFSTDPSGSPAPFMGGFDFCIRSKGNPFIKKFKRGEYVVPFLAGGPSVSGLTASAASFTLFNQLAAVPTGLAFLVNVEMEAL